MKRFGLIGYPLTHSFSKKYFEEKFLREGITGCSYDLFPLKSIEELSALRRLPGLCGLNVTIPYKKEVLRFLDDKRELPLGLQACNCIRIRDGRMEGFNTDWIGFRNSIAPLLQPHHTKALVLGSGGAAAAVNYALDSLGIPHTTVSRNPGPGALSYKQLDDHTLSEHTVIINTTPLGMSPQQAQCPPIPYEFIGRQHVLFDLVYNPEKTLFLQEGEKRGAAIRNGYEMLVLQAEENWRIWNQ
ncbi:MAG TPA: shikimate dehydrogenase [Flavisolibacter sp.]